mgnify:CR=1 FL=1
MLYIIASPIGNLEDLTLRSIRILNEVDLILCEDTRVTKKLLAHYKITKPLIRYVDDDAKINFYINKLNSNDIALVTDAGTPLLSDPGYKLVRKTIASGIHVSALPGPCAAIMALTLSGLPSDRFMFVGFLPSKHQARQKKLSALVGLDTTIVFFETAKRLSACLQDLMDIFGDRDIAIARELTKIHEEMIRGPLHEIALEYDNKKTLKGELAIVVGPPLKSNDGFSEEFIESRIIELIQNNSVRDTVIELSKETGLSKRSLYARVLILNKIQNNN